MWRGGRFSDHLPESVVARNVGKTTVERYLASPLEGTALCLSGGAYRAALFHLGGLIRLHETGELASLKMISAASAATIPASLVALNLSRLFNGDGSPDAKALRELVVDPVLAMTEHTIDAPAVLRGRLFGTSNAHLVRLIEKHLPAVKGKTLQDFPPSSRMYVAFNAINMGTSGLVSISREAIHESSFFHIKNPVISVAQAVAASCAYPVLLSPAKIRLGPARRGFFGFGALRPSIIQLTDAGQHDNLALTYAPFRTLLVSDASRPRHLRRDDNHGLLSQVPLISPLTRHVSMSAGYTLEQHKLRLMDLYRRKERSGAYWGITSEASHFRHHFDAGSEDLASLLINTRLERVYPSLAHAIINWGYLLCDAALRSYVRNDLPPPNQLPFPRK